MTVAELRQALADVDGSLQIVVRAWDDDNDFCGTPTYAEVETAHDEDDTPFFAIDCSPPDDE